MKSLKDIVLEGFFDEEIENPKMAIKTIKAGIKEFLKRNYKGMHRISQKPNEDGKFVVDCNKDMIVTNKNIEHLTNGLFVFGEVRGKFDCSECASLTSLEGAPEKVGKWFSCNECTSLTSLEGAPKASPNSNDVIWWFDCIGCTSLTSLEGAPKHTGSFDCNGCTSLTSLEGAPERTGDFRCGGCTSLTSLEGAPESTADFYCDRCTKLTSLKGAPKEVRGTFSCASCTSLTSLKGVPKEVRNSFSCYGCTSLASLEEMPEKIGNQESGGDFYGRDCKVQFDAEDIRKMSYVVGSIYV